MICIVILPEIAPGYGRIAQAFLACARGYGGTGKKITRPNKKKSAAGQAHRAARRRHRAVPLGDEI
ncbi:hypothetical protein, partial [Rhodoblastus sp.]|uniref:hypothetical protein n=1 Tax=Rhodoblastus sp. TaxID=1962975 RepID=UPI003F961013